MRAIGAALLLLATACAPAAPNPEAPETEQLLVVASTSIWGDVVSNLVRDDGEVEVLIPVGVDAHDYQPSAQQGRRMAKADLVVVNGLHLEEGLLDLVATLEGVEVLEMAELLDPVPFGEHHEDAHEDEDGHADGDGDRGHGHGALDSHVWLDPVRMARATEVLAEHLARLRPEQAERWRSRGAAYRDRILEVHREVEAILSAVPVEQRKLITNHDALGYFAERYGFEVIGTVIPGGTTLAEPSARELADLARMVEEEGVPAIFGETTDPSGLADAVAAEVGHPIRVVLLHTESLGPEGSGAETYPDMLLANARLVAEALTEG